MASRTRSLLIPFTLTAGIVALDQLTKYLITVSVRPWSIGASFLGDFFRIVRVYNPGIAFSIGHGLSGDLRALLFGFAPLIVMAIVVSVYFRTDDISPSQRWLVAGIVGGGLGNIIDRFFRPEGVLDFLDFKFYGLFGLERWPTFNVADSAVVVCGILLILSVAVAVKKGEIKGAGEKA